MVERGVSCFSISDHDTIAAYGSFEVPPHVRVVTGIEINTTYRDNEVHVLGYNIDTTSVSLRTLIENNQRERRARIDTMVNRLRAAGYSITAEAVMREAQGAKAVGRPHVAKALVRGGHVPTIEYAFRNVLARNKAGYVPSTYVTPKQAIEAIRSAGGLAVLAHPGRLRDRSIVSELVEHGIGGLEVFYHSHTEQDVHTFLEMTQRHGIVASAGSDFHDIRYHTHGVGMDVDDDAIAPFLRALAA